MPPKKRQSFGNIRKDSFPSKRIKTVIHHDNNLKENEVGITEYISKLDGFSGIIKARFSDFHVNEIDLDGNIAKLTDIKIPTNFNKKNYKKFEDLTESPIDLIPQDIWCKILDILKTGEGSVDLNVDNITKDDRGRIHECLRNNLKGDIFANTIEIDNKKIMQFKKGNDNDKRSQWPADKGKYVHFMVYKENLDTLETSLKIADALKISSSNFIYAGVKDKRAKTTQWFSVKQVEPWKLFIKTKSIRNLKVGNVTFKDNPLKLGQLSGNRFRIALRNVVGDEKTIIQSLESLKNQGFINYYGLQRFGNDREVPTYTIGNQFLLGNWKQACSIILKHTSSDNINLDVTKAKLKYSVNGNATEALKEFKNSKNRCIEYKLLEGLSKHSTNDFVTALENIPRNIRLLYLHSFQSYIWNFMVSKRISEYGLQPVVNDLVIISEENLPEKFDNNEDNNDNDNKIKTRQIVKNLEENDLSNYTIYDVVLPLPGYDIIYPKHMEKFYKEILEKHGLQLEMPKQKVKTYNLSGNYRKILGKVNDLSWKFIKYNDPNGNLILSDLEKIKGHEEPQDIETGQYKALILDFILNPSSYATMVLREILKSDTSAASHAKLNKYHEPSIILKPKSLLDDPEKFEEFKRMVFANDDDDHDNITKGEVTISKTE